MTYIQDWTGFDWQSAKYDDQDLVPGDPYQVAMLGKRMHDTAQLISEQARNLKNLADGTGWDSDAGRAFQKKVGDTASLLQKSFKRYEVAARALGPSTGRAPESNYASALEHAQTEAKKILCRAQEADTQATTYRKKVQALQPGDSSREGLDRNLGNSTSALGQASTDMTAILRFRDDQAHSAATAINHAIDHDGLKNHFSWSAAWHDFEDAVAVVGHLAGIAAAALGLLALALCWVPGVGEVLGALAAIASVVALACDTISALDGKGTWLDVAIDVVGVLSLGAGRIFGEAAEGAEAAVRGGRAFTMARELEEADVRAGSAWETVASLTGIDGDKAARALEFGPTKMLPSMKGIVGKSLNPKLYVKDIQEGFKDWNFKEAFIPKHEGPLFRDATASRFRTYAHAARGLFIGSQAGPIAAGWSNLAPSHHGENWFTSPNVLSPVKDIPGLGANGIPGVNWRWVPAS